MADDGTSGLVALERLAHVDPSQAGWDQELLAVTMGIVDALLEADAPALQSATDPLRDRLAQLFDEGGNAREVRGWLLALLSVTRWGLERLPDPDELRLARNTQRW